MKSVLHSGLGSCARAQPDCVHKDGWRKEYKLRVYRVEGFLGFRA